MIASPRSFIRNLFRVAGMFLIVEALTYGQSLSYRLEQKATVVPKSASALDQLMEVAQHYAIPMGIEWVEQSNTEGLTLLHTRKTTVHNLINQILRRTPGYRARMEHGVLHIAKPAVEGDRKNFLNLKIAEFQVTDASIFDAESILRLKIEISVHAGRYAGGWNGGYGSPRSAVLDVSNITFAGSNLTVREILNKIAAANGNTLWLVRLVPSKMIPDEPFFATYSDGSGRPGFHWRFVPLVKIKSSQ